MSLGKFSVNGVVYDLSHLNSTLIRVKSSDPQAKVFRVRINYGCHAFTKELLPTDGPELHYPDGSTVRCFCPIRYGHSKSLPAMFQAAASGGALTYFSDKNMLLLDDGHGAAGPYIVAYSAKKSNNPKSDVVIVVRSAYLKPTLAKKLSALPFYSVVAAVARGQKIVKGTPQPR